MTTPRTASHTTLSTTLALQSDRALGALVGAAPVIASGIGGRTAVLDLAGTPVFVKRIPLTDLELEQGNARCTANLFGVPTYCHYGVGSPGFGAWRELAVHDMTTNWVLAGDYDGFPLMHHHRVLPESDMPLPDDLVDVDRAVAYWGGGAQVRRRIEARGKASTSLVLFLEYIPQNLHKWLSVQLAEGGEAAERACAMVERELAAGVAFMNTRGLLHFDVHFQNILTDGRRLFFTDYGLALSDRFELAPDEAEFFRSHQSYDRMYTAWFMVIWLVTELFGHRGADRDAFIRAWSEGSRPTGISPSAAEILTRHAPDAVRMGDFLRTVQEESRQTPYPFG